MASKTFRFAFVACKMLRNFFQRVHTPSFILLPHFLPTDVLACINFRNFVIENRKTSKGRTLLLQARQQKQEERRRFEAAKEDRSLIPLNPEHEIFLFSCRNLNTDCDMITELMWRENESIQKPTRNGRRQKPFLCLMSPASRAPETIVSRP